MTWLAVTVDSLLMKIQLIGHAECCLTLAVFWYQASTLPQIYCSQSANTIVRSQLHLLDDWLIQVLSGEPSKMLQPKLFAFQDNTVQCTQPHLCHSLNQKDFKVQPLQATLRTNLSCAITSLDSPIPL